jgi:catechol 2,3-dioxygenase-like lactoylglutathione lyase family enzyme
VAFSTNSPPTECSVVRDQHNNDSSMRLKPIGPSRVAFTVKSYDRCRACYEGYLGLNVDREWTRPGERGVVYDLGPTHLELLEGPHDPVGECAYLYIPVADVDAVWEALSINATVAVPITSHDWGHRNFVVLDPAGIRLKFFSRVPEDSRVI